MFRAPPIVKPSTTAKVRAFGFISHVMEQKERYLSTFDIKAKDQVERESEKFFSKYLHDKTFKQLVDNTNKAKTFVLKIRCVREMNMKKLNPVLVAREVVR